MANWAYIENGTIMEVYDELPKNWKNVSNLDALENNSTVLRNLGWYPIAHNNIDYNPQIQRLKTLSIKFDGDTVSETYGVENLDTTFLYEKFMNELRNYRNKLLQESDFMCLYDLVQSKGEQWLIDVSSYRQQLRDLPNNYSENTNVYSINDVTWPVKPNMNEYPKITNVNEITQTGGLE